MNRDQTEPSQDELLAMAYADGELGDDERKEFEKRLVSDPTLAGHVESMRELNLVARRLIPPEPEDREWRRLSRDPLQTFGLRFAWVLCILALIAIATGIAVSTLQSDDHWSTQLAIAAGGAGVLLLLLLTLRERLAVLPHDPYRKIQR